MGAASGDGTSIGENPLVDLVIEEPRWEAAGIASIAEAAARRTLEAAGRDPARHELSLLACDDGRATTRSVFSCIAAVLMLPLLGRDGHAAPVDLT